MNFTGSQLISHNNDLMGYAYRRIKDREVCQDLVQTTYMKAIRSKHLWSGENLGGWLMAILKNVINDHYKEIYRPSTPLIDDTPLDEVAHITTTDTYKFGKIFNDDELDMAFNKLTEYQKNVIYSTYVLDIDDVDQSSTLGINKRTLISRRKKGMDQLRKWMGAVETSERWHKLSFAAQTKRNLLKKEALNAK